MKFSFFSLMETQDVLLFKEDARGFLLACMPIKLLSTAARLCPNTHTHTHTPNIWVRAQWCTVVCTSLCDCHSRLKPAASKELMAVRKLLHTGQFFFFFLNSGSNNFCWSSKTVEGLSASVADALAGRQTQEQHLTDTMIPLLSTACWEHILCSAICF